MKTIILINNQNHLSEKVSTLMQELENDSKVFSIAEPAKHILSKSLGIDMGDLEMYKDETAMYGLEIKVYPNDQPSATILYIDFKELLQNFAVGTMMDTFKETIWVEKCIENIDKNPGTFNVVTDFRFPFEEKAFKELTKDKGYKVVTINIFDSDVKAAKNPMQDFKFDYNIDYTGEPDLEDTILFIMQSIKNL